MQRNHKILQEPRAKSQEPRAKSQEPRAKSQEPRAKGLPIGNLTSQIFSNIYLNEFDRYVRHVIKPQAYIRYGDDFILFATTRKKAYGMKKLAEIFLNTALYLQINSKNDAVFPAKTGLHFLGHAVTGKYSVVDKLTSRSVLSKLTLLNASSYKSLKLARGVKEQVNRDVLEKLFADSNILW